MSNASSMRGTGNNADSDPARNTDALPKQRPRLPKRRPSYDTDDELSVPTTHPVNTPSRLTGARWSGGRKRRSVA